MYWDEDSAPWRNIESFANHRIHCYQLKPPVKTRKSSWRVRIGGRSYHELWLRHYARMRHWHPCFTMASDYANHMTRSKKPLVRSYELDLKLLCAHAEMVKGETCIKKQEQKGQ